MLMIDEEEDETEDESMEVDGMLEDEGAGKDFGMDD